MIYKPDYFKDWRDWTSGWTTGDIVIRTDDYDMFTQAEKDFVKILDLGYIIRTVSGNTYYMKVKGSRDINIPLFSINITRDFNLKFNGLEINKKYSIADLKEMMNELS